METARKEQRQRLVKLNTILNKKLEVIKNREVIGYKEDIKYFESNGLYGQAADARDFIKAKYNVVI